MNLSEKSMAAVLLCTYIGIPDDSEIKPFTPGEWEKLETVIGQKGLKIENVIDDPQILLDCGYEQSDVDRVLFLKSRGVNIALTLDKYESRGIKVITVFDEKYPPLLRRKLKLKSPAVLLYAGNIELIHKVGIGIVGSRVIDDEIIDFGKTIIKKAVNEKMVIFTGGAKGVDTIGEQTALSNGGAVVEFLADSLESKIKRPEIVNAILDDRLLLFTDTRPDMGFTVAKAMNRNKYIYASSQATFVVSADYNKGGTWAGATEALRKDYCKVFVWNNNQYNGNMSLISDKNAISYEMTNESISEIIYRDYNISNEDDSDSGGTSDDSGVQMTIWDCMGENE